MLVNVIPNRRDPNDRLAFIKGTTKLFGDIAVPAFFDKQSVKPDVGEHEVMICGVLFHKNEHGMYDWKRAPKCFFIKVPTDEIKVRYDGFECSGSMCTTDSGANTIDGTIVRTKPPAYKLDNWETRIHLITPGRLQSWLIVAENVNSPLNNRKPRTPGVGWTKINPESGHYRLEGVESLAELCI